MAPAPSTPLESARPPRRGGRIALALLVFVAAHYFVYWMLGAFRYGSGLSGGAAAVITLVGSLLLAAAAAVAVWRGTRGGATPRARASPPSTGQGARPGSRALRTTGVFVATWLFVWWVPFSLLYFARSIQTNPWVEVVVATACATVAATVAWRGGRGLHDRSSGPSVGSSVVTGALIVGAIGFVAGFFGPIILTPDASQGPLLGLFITGPAGLLLGAIGGLVYGLAKRRRRTA